MRNERLSIMIVKLHNDGKEKYQSFGASLDESDSDVYLEGYGATKEEAIEALKERVLLKIEEMKNIDYDNVIVVDCLGNPL
jgi:hypothetical protein